ncbi:MAG: DUF6282 family protein [Nitrospinota bacterium]
MSTFQPKDYVSLEGAIDIHMHPHPCLFDRITDDWGVAEGAKSERMRAIVIKCHHESTVSRAQDVNRSMEGIEVYGGIVLNFYVGGLNAAAAEAACKLGGKIVWMPTIDAENHAAAHGSRGQYDVQRGGLTGKKASAKRGAGAGRRESASRPVVSTGLGAVGGGYGGISPVDESGKLKPEALDVLAVVAKYDVALASCHLHPREIRILFKGAREMGVKKMLFTHPFFKVPGADVEFTKEMVRLGAVAEWGYCTVSPMWGYARIDQVAAAIGEVGPQNSILMSDLGQRHNPMPQEGLRVFAQCLYEKGIPEKDIRTMIVTNPKRVLGLN